MLPHLPLSAATNERMLDIKPSPPNDRRRQTTVARVDATLMHVPTEEASNAGSGQIYISTSGSETLMGNSDEKLFHEN